MVPVAGLEPAIDIGFKPTALPFRYTGCKLADEEGLEPSTPWFRARCSTIALLTSKSYCITLVFDTAFAPSFFTHYFCVAYKIIRPLFQITTISVYGF